jgi:hypothetical protein
MDWAPWGQNLARIGEGEGMVSRVIQTWTENPSSVLNGCVTAGKLLNSSEPGCATLQR